MNKKIFSIAILAGFSFVMLISFQNFTPSYYLNVYASSTTFGSYANVTNLCASGNLSLSSLNSNAYGHISSVYGYYADSDVGCSLDAYGHQKCTPIRPYGCAYAYKAGDADPKSCNNVANFAQVGNDWNARGPSWQSSDMRGYLPVGYTIVFFLSHKKPQHVSDASGCKFKVSN